MRRAVLRSLMLLGGLILLQPATVAAEPFPAVVFGAGAPTFSVYPAPSSLTNSDNAGEPSIGVDWRTGRVMYEADNSTYAVSFDDSVNPARASWADAQLPQMAINLDPILTTDHSLGRTWAGGLATACSLLAYTDVDGPPWTQTRPCTGTYDHETIGSGPWAGGTPAGAYGHALYYCAQGQSAGDACVTSSNGGASYSSPVFWNGSCGGLHGHVKVSADGTAYVPDATCGQNVGGVSSRDDGRSWNSYVIPDAVSPSRGFDPSVATTSDNTVYEAWARAGDYHPMVERSTDHGATWSGAVDLAGTTSPRIVASTFQAAVGGSNGRVAVAYLGTTTGNATDPFDPGTNAVWYLYVSLSYDAGQSWTTVNVTPGDPVQRGCISDGGTTSTGCRNLLDFIDASVTSQGRVVVGYADGCINACDASTGTANQSGDSYATIARQSGGGSLIAAGSSAAVGGSGGGQTRGGGSSGGQVTGAKLPTPTPPAARTPTPAAPSTPSPTAVTRRATAADSSGRAVPAWAVAVISLLVLAGVGAGALVLVRRRGATGAP